MIFDVIAFIFSLAILVIIYLLYRRYSSGLNKIISDIKKRNKDNDNEIAKKISNQIISNKLYNGRDGSISFVVYRDELSVNINNIAIFTLPNNVDKYIPLILNYIRNAKI